MEEKRNNRTLWIVVAVIVGALFICVVSAVAGGAIGYMIGLRSAQYETPKPYYRHEYEMPMPRVPEMPVIPEMPELPERIEPFSGQSYGALITQVEPDSPAAEAGLQVSDIVLAVNGQTLTAEVGLRDLLLDYEPGDNVELIVARDNARQWVSVELGQHPDRQGRAAYLGVIYRSVPLGMQQRRRN